MVEYDEDPPSLRRVEGPIGPMATRLLEREVALARTRSGDAVLIRPNEVLISIPTDADGAPAFSDAEITKLAGTKIRQARKKVYVDRSDEDDVTSTIREVDRSVGTFRVFEIESARFAPKDGTEERWDPRPVSSVVDQINAEFSGTDEKAVRARPHYVYMANVAYVGSSAYWANPSYSWNSGYAANPSYSWNSVPRTSARPANAVHVPDRCDTGHPDPVVAVLDTGLATLGEAADRIPEHPALRRRSAIHHPWRQDDVAFREIDDDDEVNANASGRVDREEETDDFIDVAAGHGTFIGGVIAQTCPNARLHYDGVLSSFGDGDDESIADGIDRAVSRGAQIIVLSLGAFTDHDDEPPLAVDIRRHAADGVVFVAAAGNAGIARPYYPAAMPEVIGVGALDTAGRAWFSNFGGWVDACAPGVDVVSTYFMDAKDGTADDGPIVEFTGWASWNGTSFSAPRVAAAIAQDMVIRGGTAAEAWKRLSDWQKYRYPDLGVVFNIG